MLGLTAACVGRPDLQRPQEPPDIVLLIATGLRAGDAEQALYEAWGDQPTLRFSNAYAQSCVPFTSMGALLTSRYPSNMAMCATGNVNAFTEGDERPWCARIPDEVWTLPEVLHIYGYASAAFVAATSPTVPTDWDALHAHGHKWWTAHADQPRLYVAQVLDLHMLQFDAITGYTEQKANHDRRIAVASPEVLQQAYVDRARVVGEKLREFVEASLPTADRPREVWLTSTNGLSLRETTGLDSDHLLATTNTLIVDRTVHVPLARWSSDATSSGDVRDEIVELIDVLPTFVAMAQGTQPAGAQGRDLLSSDPDPAPYAYAEFGDMLAIREGDDLLTFRFYLHNASSLDPRLTEGLSLHTPENSKFFALHNIRRDPFQTNNELSTRTPRAVELRNQLLSIRTGPGAPPPDAMTQEQLEALRLNPANGYW